MAAIHPVQTELRTENASSYLKSRGFEPLDWTVSELGGGVSNTVLLVEAGTTRFILKQALGKLRVAEDWFSDRQRIFRESAALRALVPHLSAGAVPEVLFEDRPNYLFGMTAAPPGSKTWKSLLFAGEMEAETAEEIGRILATIVRISWRNAEWEAAFGDQTVFDQLRLDPYYRTTALRHPDLRPQFEILMEESRNRRVSAVHGDWSPKNFLIAPGTVMAIDFEVIHFGDPAFDTAFLLNHLLMKTFYLPDWSGRLAMLAARFWKTFREGLPADSGWLEAATLQHLGCLLLARIDGKSPAEYLAEQGLRERVRNFARQLILTPPKTINEVFERL